MLETYVTWIETIPWNYFATFTTQREMTVNSARRYMEIFHKKMTIEGRDDWIFWTAEKFKLKDGYHLHALIKTRFPWDKESLWLLWQDVSVGKGQISTRTDGKVYNRCDIRKRNPKKQAASYMFKDARYTMKSMFKFEWGIEI